MIDEVNSNHSEISRQCKIFFLYMIFSMRRLFAAPL